MLEKGFRVKASLFEFYPKEIALTIIGFFKVKDIAAIASVSKADKKLIDDEKVWRNLLGLMPQEKLIGMSAKVFYKKYGELFTFNGNYLEHLRNKAVTFQEINKQLQKCFNLSQDYFIKKYSFFSTSREKVYFKKFFEVCLIKLQSALPDINLIWDELNPIINPYLICHDFAFNRRYLNKPVGKSAKKWKGVTDKKSILKRSVCVVLFSNNIEEMNEFYINYKKILKDDVEPFIHIATFSHDLDLSALEFNVLSITYLTDFDLQMHRFWRELNHQLRILANLGKYFPETKFSLFKKNAESKPAFLQISNQSLKIK